MVRRALILLCFGLMTVFMASCGQTYKLMSITVTPGALDAAGNASIDLDGAGAFQQLTVTATYSNTKTQVVTLQSVYQVNASAMDQNNPGCETTQSCIAPLSSVVANLSGMVNVVNYSCTWDTEPTNSGDTAWLSYTSPYKVKVTYTENGVTATAYLDVSVANSADCFDAPYGKFSPPTGFPGNSVTGY